MGKEDEVFDLAHLARTLNSRSQSKETLTWYTPVRFDPGLLKKLLDQHDEIDAHVASLPNRFRRDREEAWRATQSCAGQLHEVRRQEALWVYPVIAHGLANDAKARRQLLNLRFVMNGLARHALRRIDDLAKAVHHLADIRVAVDTVSHALTEYRQRNESELYTLYGLMDPRQASLMSSRTAASSAH
jgi:hypothetical protein